jgi:hypothetical protein
MRHQPASTTHTFLSQPLHLYRPQLAATTYSYIHTHLHCCTAALLFGCTAHASSLFATVLPPSTACTVHTSSCAGVKFVTLPLICFLAGGRPLRLTPLRKQTHLRVWTLPNLCNHSVRQPPRGRWIATGVKSSNIKRAIIFAHPHNHSPSPAIHGQRGTSAAAVLESGRSQAAWLLLSV